MRNSFPTSYPCLTDSGLVVTEELLNELSKELFLYSGSKGLEFGVEMAYMLLWVIDTAKDEEELFEIGHKAFSKVSRRRPSSSAKPGQVETTAEDIEKLLDPVDMAEAEVELDIENIQKEAGAALQELDRVARYRLMQRLKNKMEGVDD